MATSTINTKVKMDGEREYRAALAQINAGLKNLGAEMRSVEQDFTDNADSIEALSAKNDVLSRQIDTQKEKVETLREVLQKAGETYGEADKRTIDWKTSLINAETELKKMERSLSDGRDALEKASNATDELSGGMGELESSAEGTADALSDVKSGEVETSGSTTSLGGVVQSLADKLGFSLPDGATKAIDALGNIDLKTAGLVGSFGAVLAAIVKVEKALIDMTNDSASSAKEILTVSEVTGQSASQIQEFEYASKFLGVSVDKLKDGLKETTNKMQEARDGSADAADAFNRLGVRVTDSRGELRDAGEVFYEVIDALGEMRNKTERDATAMDILGESAQDLNPLINRGSEALKEYAQEAHDMGYVMDTDALAALNAVDDAYKRMQSSQEGAKNQMSEEFAPYLEEFYNSLGELFTRLSDSMTQSNLIEVFGTLLDLLNSALPLLGSLGDIATTLTPLFTGLGGAISIVADALKVITELVQGLTSLVGGNVASLLSGGGLSLQQLPQAISNIEDVFNGTNSATARFLNGHATGTDNFPGGVTWVGENGPELVYLPQGSQIRSNQESRAVSGGDVFYVTIDAKNVKSFNDVVRVADNKRRAARMGVR